MKIWRKSLTMPYWGMAESEHFKKVSSRYFEEIRRSYGRLSVGENANTGSDDTKKTDSEEE